MALAGCAFSRHALADALCLPAVQSVPGFPSGQAPDWSATGGPFGKLINDPRWTGAEREDFPSAGGGIMPEVAARGLFKGTKVYFSLQTLVDDDGSTSGFDSVYLGFGSGAAAAEVLRITLSGPGPYAGDVLGASRTLATWKWNGTSWSSTGLPEAWTTADANAIGIWADNPAAVGNKTWGVHLTFDTAATSPLGLALGGAVTKVWYQVSRYHSTVTGDLLYARHKWPYASDAFADDPSDPTHTPPPSSFVTTLWADLNFGTAAPSCPSGISIAPEQIGTTPTTAGVPSDVIHWGNDSMGNPASNTFVALPTYPAGTPAANVISASFRIADWGSQIGDSNTDWRDFIPAPGTVANDLTGKISWSCSGPACPQLPVTSPAANPDQCMLVQLFAASPGSGTPVHFLHDSARRNMSFVHLSKFARPAKISIAGLAPLAGTVDRDVYIYVATRNMPENSPSKTPPLNLEEVLRGRRGEDGGTNYECDLPKVDNPEGPNGGNGGVGMAVGAGGGKGPVPRSRQCSFYDRVSSLLPTYEVHIYHSTGHDQRIGGKLIREVESQAPFGYFAIHDTTPDGWKTSLEGAGFNLEEIAPQLYHLKIPNNGSAIVETKLATCDKHLFGLIRCCCDVVGARGGDAGGLAALLGLLGLVAIRARGRSRVA